MSSFLYRIGRASFHARKRVLAIWLAVIAAAGVAAWGLGGQFNDAFDVPGASSTVALKQLKVTFPAAADASATVLIVAPPGQKLNDPSVKEAIAAWSDRLEKVPFVNGVIGPYSDQIEGLISDEGTSGRVTVRVDGAASTITDAQREELTTAARSLEQSLPGSKVLVGGEIFSIHIPRLSPIEALGVVVAIVVLIATLGSLAASMMPIGTAVVGVGIGVLLVRAASGLMEVSSTTLILAIMLALAVGIDYALFIIARHRDQLATGMDAAESAARAVGTAGSAVVFAGLTVIIALVGLSIANLPFITVMGVFAAVAVAVEVVLALTLLPALMGFAGERLRPKPRRQLTDAKPTSHRASGPSARWVRVVTRWPLVTILLVVVGMGALAYPTLGLQLGLPNAGRSLPGTQDRETFDQISDRFGVGFNGPLVITGSIVESKDPIKILDGLKADIQAMPGVELVAAATPNANADTAMIQVIPTTGPDDPATADLVERIRQRQGEWLQRYDIDTAVTGFTAVQIDVTNRLRDALLPFGVFVVGLSLILLTLVFRSIWVPVKAALGYLLSVGAAFGATALVFNYGWLAAVINLAETGPVISFLPIILMGILFGLAMDYEVFLVSRMREEYVHGNSNRWIEDGFVHSAKVVAAAGLIMFAVFAFFVPNGEGAIKPIAFALAVGVALDAFVVRMTLVPAVMKLLGRHAWWLPRWLDARLPVLDVEGESLARQLELADWPTPDNTSVVFAEGLSASVDGRTLFSELDLDLPPGKVLVVEGEAAQTRALLLGLAGRLQLSGGQAKVLGLVLPQESALLRTRVPVLGPGLPHFDQVLANRGAGLVVVERADELSDAQDQALRRAMAESRESDRPVTWLLGALPDSVLIDQLPGARVLRIRSHLVEGAKR